MKNSYFSHSTDIEIPFFDVDMLEIVWHGNYVKYLEVARCNMLNQIGYNYMTMQDHGYAWPVIQMQCKFIRPLRFGQTVRVYTHLVEFETYLKIDYDLVLLDTQETVHRATTTQAVVDIQTGEMQFQTPQSWQECVRKVISCNASSSS